MGVAISSSEKIENYNQVWEAHKQEDGTVHNVSILASFRDPKDAIAFCARSARPCLQVIGPHGGRLTFTRNDRGYKVFSLE